MSGYPPTSQGYGYGYGGGNQPPPPQPPYSSGGNNPPYGSSTTSSPYAVPYGASKPQSSSSSAPTYGSSSYGAPPPSAPYAPSPGDYNKPPKEKPYGGGYGAPPPSGSSDYGSYGAGPRPSQPSGHGGGYGATPPHGVSDYGSYGGAPPRPASSGHGGGYGGYPPQASYGSPFASLIPSGFAPGTDPNIVACFQAADQDGSGFIDDKELQGALSSYQQRFSMRTVHLLMYLFTNSNAMKIGPKEFTALFYSLQNWRSIFERSDKDRSGRIDVNELRDALLSLGFSVSPVVLDLLVSKFDKSGGKNRAIEYDNFIECCLTVKGLTEKFKEKDTAYSGSATFNYESFMLTVLPFLIA
ncbi:EF-hand Calcium binding protein-like [Arabidopsis thaliana]|uniref:Probable calcium-binding protein CML50 n=1 Tax=Arabidopsis thaliana TaxID=3702 RepID=CML50_ARATH|nr:Calcium-binding EF-hand family protein [Arabidopsis thaliana]Q9FYE4.1 RecName: Full=Probable calcium-binding protein CML50; AltName: Full=Calmodulin-like protein 50 [Arabidopsis thaliana]AAL91231.1 EF-hand calcium binding protein-like [Arabidopsis thaliana]AAP68277.1 At5g04170 [Arabidopsis thaliana]AED90707.1 Calcium-binding EF-hand family protein [Arabidopsis thaliana]CAC05499.1 EF-hand Calcium binding protein-like [Arabidopsis thaliana]|eukprot:NP_196037.2 Calcium-binding EF-hand family protein [Arabidopsis thaliana]